jgi:hypothetical protein
MFLIFAKTPVSVSRKGSFMTLAPLSLHSDGVRRFAWIGLMVVASVLFSFTFACGTPFAALAALAALDMSRRDGLIAIIGVWLINQAIGFCALGYPWDALTFAWGVAIGGGAALSLLGAGFAAECLRSAHIALRGAAAFVAAFAVYEAALYAATFPLGGADAAFSADFVARIFEIDAVSFVALLALHRAAQAIGFAAPAPKGLAASA